MAGASVRIDDRFVVRHLFAIGRQASSATSQVASLYCLLMAQLMLLVRLTVSIASCLKLGWVAIGSKFDVDRPSIPSLPQSVPGLAFG